MYKITIKLFVLTYLFMGCVKTQNKEDKQINSENQITETFLNVDSLIQVIDQKRSEIEKLTIPPIELSTKNLREKIKQKWSKIHFYVQNNQVIKIKTYPYPEITKRTEEFYASEKGLILVVIEDNGEGKKGKSKDQIDKMYYFDNGKLIKEINNKNEVEYALKESDALELLSEFNEYLDIFKKNNN